MESICSSVTSWVYPNKNLPITSAHLSTPCTHTLMSPYCMRIQSSGHVHGVALFHQTAQCLLGVQFQRHTPAILSFSQYCWSHSSQDISRGSYCPVSIAILLALAPQQLHHFHPQVEKINAAGRDVTIVPGEVCNHIGILIYHAYLTRWGQDWNQIKFSDQSAPMFFHCTPFSISNSARGFQSIGLL